MADKKLFEVKGYSSSNGESGDFDGHWEITNGKVTILTNDMVDEDMLQPIAQALNDSDCDFYLDDANTFLMYEYEKEWKRERDKAAVLVKALEQIQNMKREPGETDDRYAFNRCWHIATDTLSQYNENHSPSQTQEQ